MDLIQRIGFAGSVGLLCIAVLDAQTTKATVATPVAAPTTALVADPPGWQTVASASTTFSTTPSVLMPAGTVFRFWGTSGIAPFATTYCTTQVATNQPVQVWVNPCPGSTADYAPFGNHSIQVQQGAQQFTVSIITPGAADPMPVTVLAAGGTTPPVIPPATPGITEFSCPGPSTTYTVTNADGTTSTFTVSPPSTYFSTAGAKAVATAQGACTAVSQ